MRLLCTCSFLAFFLAPVTGYSQDKPLITLDEFMNATDILDAQLSPDGTAAVIATDAPDWQSNRFKEDLWLWTRDGGLKPLTHSGHDSSPQWSPDGKYVAFVSDRAITGSEDDGDDGKDKDETGRVWLIPTDGGEAFPLYREKLDAHTFAWSPDSASIEFSAPDPMSKDAEQKYKDEWKDVIRWREQERGDVLLALPIDAANKTPTAHEDTQSEQKPVPAHGKPIDEKPAIPASARVITRSPFAIDEIAPSYDGQQIAFQTGSNSHRVENPADFEIFLVAAAGGEARQLTHNQGLETRLSWARDGKSIFFMVQTGSGSIEGQYQDVQGRLYSLDLTSLKVTRLGAEFKGSWAEYTVTADGELLATGSLGVNQHLYRVHGSEYKEIGTVSGTYTHAHAALHGDALLFEHSTINEPAQVYFASSLKDVDTAKPVTAFNPVFAQRAQVSWKPYQWKSDDGTAVEGVLIYPPGKKGAKHLRMFTLIHGGPEDADGNHFGADWYDWATLAAANGWLVFRPNYRGSTSYGDSFMLAIQPHLVSAPGHDILSGVDSLVRDGIADPDHLTIGGYSYGGYMTNWLITQTTRFKAAVTGAGAVEHAANWGNDDLTFDDAWYLSGAPWEKPEIYQSEAALFQMNKVTTPTHIVGGDADVRVSYLEDVLLERALQRLNVPHALLVLPGENHPLSKDPWHGYIKVREELKWLAKYGEN